MTAGFSRVVVRDGRATLHTLGPGDDAIRQIKFLRFALHRLSLFSGRADTSSAARTAAVYAQHLDELLLGPVRKRIDGRPLVLVPTGALNAVPWSVLATCRGRPVTVAPSAAVWLRAAADRGPADGSPADGSPVLTAGPGLAAAPLEVESLSGSMPDAQVLVGSDATVGAVARALDGAPLAHVAAHGTFRADNPLFSSLELADGPLTVYDLEQLRRPPRRIVLSACDSGLSAVRPGDELMGLSAALLGLGTRTLVATVVPVPDGATTPLMLDLHQRMRAGLSPAAALAAAQEAYSGGGDLAYATSAGFVCFGAG